MKFYYPFPPPFSPTQRSISTRCEDGDWIFGPGGLPRGRRLYYKVRLHVVARTCGLKHRFNWYQSDGRPFFPVLGGNDEWHRKHPEGYPCHKVAVKNGHLANLHVFWDKKKLIYFGNSRLGVRNPNPCKGGPSESVFGESAVRLSYCTASLSVTPTRTPCIINN